ncbi:15506_t:CDS:2 [Gigaspora margarita]|uniref:15506_t:CDS:1 n=1 Tax=Gigaspora margarita TaxID=4874 RepID=A0ABN7UKA7_GIGMA|nr:15506_t:CDS:2 [Gigaspora margarita]
MENQNMNNKRMEKKKIEIGIYVPSINDNGGFAQFTWPQLIYCDA